MTLFQYVLSPPSQSLQGHVRRKDVCKNTDYFLIIEILRCKKIKKCEFNDKLVAKRYHLHLFELNNDIWTYRSFTQYTMPKDFLSFSNLHSGRLRKLPILI